MLSLPYGSLVGGENTETMYVYVLSGQGEDWWNWIRRVAVPWEGWKYGETKEEWQSPEHRLRD